MVSIGAVVSIRTVASIQVQAAAPSWNSYFSNETVSGSCRESVGRQRAEATAMVACCSKSGVLPPSTRPH